MSNSEIIRSAGPGGASKDQSKQSKEINIFLDPKAMKNL